MKEVKRYLRASLRLSGCISLIYIGGCAKIDVLPDSEVPIPHPTMEGYQCLSPGYLMKIMDEYENCLKK